MKCFFYFCLISLAPIFGFASGEEIKCLSQETDVQFEIPAPRAESGTITFNDWPLKLNKMPKVLDLRVRKENPTVQVILVRQWAFENEVKSDFNVFEKLENEVSMYHVRLRAESTDEKDYVGRFRIKHTLRIEGYAPLVTEYEGPMTCRHHYTE